LKINVDLSLTLALGFIMPTRGIIHV
jgi:hypothetical protein